MPNRLSSTLRIAAAVLALTSVTATTSVASAAGHRSKAPAGGKGGAKADLTTRDVDVELGDTQMEITGRILNTGGRKAKRSDLVIAISTDATLSDDDNVIGDIGLKGIKPGKSRAIDTDVDLPEDADLPSGTVYLLVCADGGEAVAEKNESNNCDAEVIGDAVDGAVADDDGPSVSDDAPADESAGDDQAVQSVEADETDA